MQNKTARDLNNRYVLAGLDQYGDIDNCRRMGMSESAILELLQIELAEEVLS